MSVCRLPDLAAALALSSLLLAAPAVAAEARPRDPGPPGAPAPSIHFPSFVERSLPNGLRVVVIEHHEQPVVSLRLMLAAGKAFEPAGRVGAASATAALLTQGTGARSAQQIAETIDFVGGSLGATAAMESARVNLAVTADQAELGFSLLADVVLHPTFPQEELDRWRGQALSGVQVEMQNAGFVAGNALLRALFGDHPYGHSGRGTAETLAALTRDDLVSFHARNYVPNGAVLAVVGDVRAEQAFASAERAFGAWAQGEPTTLPQVADPAAPGVAEGEGTSRRRVIVIDKPGAVQTQIVVGQLALRYRDPDHFAADVYGAVLGSSPRARLTVEIREKRGLSYGAAGWLAGMTQSGWLQASTSTKSATTVEALEVLLEVLRGLQQAPVPAAELSSATTYVTGALPLVVETPDGIADRVLQAMWHGYGPAFLEGYNQRLAAVDAAELQRFARERTSPEQMTVVLVGDAAAFGPALAAKFGPVETIPLAEVDLMRADLRRQPPAATAGPEQ
jgi:zinc protease